MDRPPLKFFFCCSFLLTLRCRCCCSFCVPTDRKLGLSAGLDDLPSDQSAFNTDGAGRDLSTRPAVSEPAAANASAPGPPLSVPPLKLSAAISNGTPSPASVPPSRGALDKSSAAASVGAGVVEGAGVVSHSAMHTEIDHYWDGVYPVRGGHSVRAKVLVSAAAAKAAAPAIKSSSRVAVNCSAEAGSPSLVQVWSD